MRPRPLTPLITAATALGLLLSASPASADFTRLKIREVKPGATTPAGSEFVELQMYEGAQQNVAGKQLTFFGPAGTATGSFTFPADAESGRIQRTILAGTADVATEFGVTPDFVLPGPLLAGEGGAVCYLDIDCVAWGAFPAPQGTAAAIPAGSSLTRSIERGCPTYLEEGDDSNFSSLDFDVTSPPTPQSNATAPAEVACPGLNDRRPPETRITKGPFGETSKRGLRVKFTSTEPGSTFECRLDRAKWENCDSPWRPLSKGERLGLGEHRVEVRATDEAGNTDERPARRSWKIVRRGR